MRNQHQKQIPNTTLPKRRAQSYVFPRPISEATEGQWKQVPAATTSILFPGTRSALSVVLTRVPLPPVRLGADFLHLRVGSREARRPGSGTAKASRGGRNWGVPRCPHSKWRRKPQPVRSGRAHAEWQSPAWRWGAGLRREGHARPADGPEVIGSAAASSATIASPRLWKGRWSR